MKLNHSSLISKATDADVSIFVSGEVIVYVTLVDEERGRSPGFCLKMRGRQVLQCGLQMCGTIIIPNQNL